MNIESANVSPLLPSNSVVEGVSLPLAEDGAIPEGFSEALLAQIELLMRVKQGSQSPLQAQALTDSPNINPQDVAGLIGSKRNMQELAALSDKDLPVTDTINDADNLSATLDAVTDTLKYIAAGNTAEEKAAETERNMKDVIAMAAEAEQSIKDVAVINDAPVQMDAGLANRDIDKEAKNEGQDQIASAEDISAQEEPAAAIIFPPVVLTEQEKTDNKAVQDDAIKERALLSFVKPLTEGAKLNLSRKDEASDDASQQEAGSRQSLSLEGEKTSPNEGRDQIASAEDISVQEEPVAVIVLPPVVLTEQEKTDNKAVQDDAIKERVLLSFVKPLTEGAKLNLSRKDEASGDTSQQEADFHQSAQDKQSFNLKYLENAGPAEKTGQIERQSLSLEGDKVSPRVTADMAQLNRPIADNKTGVPALVKPLSHPEWNKDLGDRIVWMNNKAIPAAEIKMNPQHLGPISVRIDVNQDHQANIVFTAQHAVVREALEASIPKLREMMSAQQLNLVDVNISQNSTSGQGQSQPQGFAQMADGGRRGKGAEGMMADGISDAMEDVENGQAVVSKGLLSIYA